MLSIKNNLMAENAARHLGQSYDSLAKSVERLSSGLRINGAKDDAAGLAVRELIRGDVAQLSQAARNAQDAVSMLQTAEGAMAVIDELLVRMKELAEQAATGSYSSDQISIMNNEYTQLGEEITRIAQSTKFNGTSLLDNTTAIAFHLGSSGAISFTPENMTAGSSGLQVDATPNSTSTALHGRNYATTVDSIYVQAADITDDANDIVQINMATDSDVSVDIGAYAATGITLSQLISALNDAAIAGDWSASDPAFAKAEYDADYGAYRLRVTALTAGAVIAQ
jgi:flagellin